MRKLLGAVAAVLVACGGGKHSGSTTEPPTSTPPPPPTTPPPTTPTEPTSPPATPPPPASGSACTPGTCSTLAKNCGPVPDGCGGMLFCGNCPAGQVCGDASVCAAAPAACTPTTCAAAGKDCGPISNGCGGTLDCGACSGAATCGGGGDANVCGKPPVQGGETKWATWAGGAEQDSFLRLRADSAGNLVVLGTRTATDGQSLLVRKFKSDGTLVWDKVFGGGAQAWVYPAALAVAPGGEILVAVSVGCSQASCGVDFGGGKVTSALVKLGADGGFQWQKVNTYGYGAGSVAVDAGGNVASQSYDPDTGAIVELFAPDGTSRWKSVMNDAHALAFAPDGSLYVSWSEPKTFQPKLSKLDASGKTLWTQDARWMQALATSARGTPVGLEWQQLAVFEPDTGNLRFRVSLPMFASDLAVQPGAHEVVRAIVVGQDSGGCSPMAVRAYDLAGDFLWSRLVGANGSCGGAPIASGVAVLDGGDAVVAGTATVQTDLGKGERTPEGPSDGFLLELAP